MPDIIDPLDQDTAPPGAAPETEVSEVTVTGTRPPKSKLAEFGTRVKGGARAVGEGLLFGFEDRLEAMLRTGRISGAEYKAMRDQIRAEQAAYAAKHPIEAGALEIGGALTTTLPMLAVPGAGEVAGASTLAKLGRLAAIGAGEGALQGAGSSDELLSAEGAQKTAEGALAGAALAPVVGYMPQTASRVVGTLKNIFTRPSQREAEQKALEIAAAALQRQGKTAAEIEAELARLRARNTPASFGEVGAPGVTREVMRTPQGAEMAAETLSRQGAAGERVGEKVSEAVTKGASYDTEREALVERMRRDAKPNYERAYAHGEVNDPQINHLLSLDSMRPFWNEAMKAAEREADVVAAKTGRPPVNPLREYLTPVQRESGVLGADGKPLMITEYVPSGDKVPTVEVLDWLKRGMDEAIERGYRAGNMSAKEATDLRALRGQLTGRLDTLVPEYGQARAAFKGDAEIRDAFDMGMGANLSRGEKAVDRMRPEELAKWAGGASDAEKQAAFTGYGNFLLNEISKNPKANPADLILAPNRMARLEALASNPAEVDVLKSALARESELFAQRKGSISAMNDAVRKGAQEDMARGIETGNADIIAAALRSGNLSVFSGLALRILGHGGAHSPEVLTELANVLRRGSPEEIAQTVTRLSKVEGEMAAREARKSSVRDALAVAAGTLPAGEEAPGGPVSGEEGFEPKPGPEDINPDAASIGAPETVNSGTASTEAPEEGAAPIGVRNNNPGNMKAAYTGAKGVTVTSPFIEKMPGYKGYDDRGFAIFDTMENGIAAQERLLERNYGGLTINQIVEKYAPSEENPPEVRRNYKAYLAKELGIAVGDVPRDLSALAAAIRRFETGRR